MSTAFQNLDKLSDSLYEDLIVKANEEIAELKKQAEQERDKIINEAKLKADSYFKETERKLKQIKEVQESELNQAALQLKQKLEDQILHLVKKDWIDPNIERNLDDQELVKSLILSFTEQIQAGSYQLQIPAKLEADWKGFVKDKLTDLELVKSDDLNLKLISTEDGFQLNFGPDEFKALFQEFLNEDLSKMLFEND